MIALAALAGLIVWIVVDSGGSSGSPSTSKPTSISDVALTEAGLKTVVSALGTPVYWVGAAKGVKYELIQLPSGISVRYLPAGVEPSDKRPFLTVATFPVKDAFKVTTRPSAGAELLGLPGSGVGVVNKGHATTVYIAYPGVDYQIALYNPSPLAARLLATSGRVRAIASTGAAQSGGPVAASPVKLRGLSGSLGHPIYWVGNWRGFTYELTETADGRVLIRYLPKGVQVGTKRPELTVATYPMENAFAVTKRGATGSGVSLIHLKDGGIAVYSTQRPEVSTSPSRASTPRSRSSRRPPALRASSPRTARLQRSTSADGLRQPAGVAQLRFSSAAANRSATKPGGLSLPRTARP